MKKILYYITDHGLGHTTRSIAIIRKLITEGIDVTIRNSNVNYLQKSLPHTKIISGITDVGPSIKKNGISIDNEKTLKNIGEWIDSIHKRSNIEYELISKINPDLIISDISVMPFFAAHKAQIPSIAISNFAWTDVLKGFPKKQIELLEEGYGFANLAIQLPLGPKMKSFQNKKQVGLVCRKPTDSRKNIRKKLGIKDSDICIFANLDSYFTIKPQIDSNVKIFSTGVQIQTDNITYIDPWTEGQDLISASDLVLSKCGYGISSECLTNGIPFLYISDNNHLEQKAISYELNKKGLQNRILEHNLNDLVLNSDTISKIKNLKEENQTYVVVNMIKEIILK